MSEQRRRRRNSGPLGAVLLILIGVILLLNVLGVLDWNIWWSVLRLWPVLLIAAGLELLLGRTRWGALLATILVVAVIVAALWLTYTGAMPSGLETAQIRQPLGESTRAEVSLEPVVGTLRLEAASEAANLIEGEIRKGRSEDIQESFSLSGDTAIYSLGTDGPAWDFATGAWDQTRTWDLGFSPGASLALDTELAVGDDRFDLTGLAIESLSADMGMGRILVTLPETGRFSAKLSQGLGVLEIVVPMGMAVRIQTDTALAGRQIPDDLVKAEEFYTSPGYDSAEDRVEIDAAVAMGLLKVRYQE
jgi:hypothetical protein